MALFNFFKKKKPAEEKTKEKKKVKADGEKKPSPKEPGPEVLKPKSDVPKQAYRVLRKPRITEKATDLARQNRYVFEVFPESNKTEIKNAIEETYGVEVLSLNIIKIPPKRRRLGKTQGWRKKYKKAIIKIKEGQKIEVLPR